MSQEFDSPAATQQAEPATDPPSAATRLVTWHGDLLVWVDQSLDPGGGGDEPFKVGRA